METIDTILDRMKQVIEQNEIKAPVWWLDEAQKLAVLRLTLKNELIRAEIEYKNEIMQLALTEAYNKAKNSVEGRLAETLTPYEKYKRLLAKDDAIDEIIKISKKRAATTPYV